MAPFDNRICSIERGLNMAGLKIMGKLAEGSSDLLNKAKAGIAAKAEPAGSLGSVKKQVNELLQEKSRLYGVIGMEACDLHRAGSLQSRELELYFEKMEIISQKLEQLEEERKALEARAQKNNICECGCKLPKNVKFCPNCGIPVEIAAAGQQAAAAVMQEAAEQECICGAKIKPGQFMCMECGRRTGQEA